MIDSVTTGATLTDLQLFLQDIKANGDMRSIEAENEYHAHVLVLLLRISFNKPP